MQTPSVGRIVHSVGMHDSKHIAAIITEVQNSELGIVLLLTFPSLSVYSSSYDARMSPGTWHYPEVVNTVSHHESENEAEKREGPISNSPEIG